MNAHHNFKHASFTFTFHSSSQFKISIHSSYFAILFQNTFKLSCIFSSLFIFGFAISTCSGSFWHVRTLYNRFLVEFPYSVYYSLQLILRGSIHRAALIQDCRSTQKNCHRSSLIERFSGRPCPSRLYRRVDFFPLNRLYLMQVEILHAHHNVDNACRLVWGVFDQSLSPYMIDYKVMS